MKITTYRLGGLRIASEFPLLGLQEEDTEARSDVQIRCAPIEKEITSATAKFKNGQFYGKYDGREFLLDFQQFGRFLVRAGEEILIDLAPQANETEVRARLL